MKDFVRFENMIGTMLGRKLTKNLAAWLPGLPSYCISVHTLEGLGLDFFLQVLPFLKQIPPFLSIYTNPLPCYLKIYLPLVVYIESLLLE